MVELYGRGPSIEDIMPKLLELGADPDIDRPEVLSRYPELHHVEHLIRRLGGPLLDSIMAPLSTPELECLLKGLTIAELRLRWCVGSVSPVIRILDEFDRRSPSDAYRLHQWVIRRSTNRYTGGLISEHVIPVLDQMSPEEREIWFLAFQESCRRDWERRHREQLARRERAEREAERRRQEKERRKAQKRTRDVQRRQARERLIERAAPLDDIGRLRLIIENQDMRLDAFPSEWARMPVDFRARMTRADIEALLARISRKRKGVWRDLCRRIMEEMQ